MLMCIWITATEEKKTFLTKYYLKKKETLRELGLSSFMFESERSGREVVLLWPEWG